MIQRWLPTPQGYKLPVHSSENALHVPLSMSLFSPLSTSELSIPLSPSSPLRQWFRDAWISQSSSIKTKLGTQNKVPMF